MKAKIKSVVDTTKKTKAGISILEVYIEGDDRKLTAFDEKFKTFLPGDEIEIEPIKESKYGDFTNYFINLVKDKSAGGGYKGVQKDWNFEKRKAALNSAVELGKSTGTHSAAILKVAEEFFKFLAQ